MEFLNALSDPTIPFFRYAFFTGLLASVAFGIIGTYVVARRISYIAGAIAHCVLGGIGAGLYLQAKMAVTWFGPLSGAIIAGLLAAIIIGLVSLHANQREDTVIGALWAIGMAVGLLFIAKTPGYIEPMSYLFGNILLIAKTDLWLVIGLDAAVVTIAAVFYHKFLAVCFDEEYARLRGIRTDFYYLLLLCLTALTVVLLVRIVGIVMVIALLTLPAAVAGNFAKGLWQMMITATGFCMFFISTGLASSYTLDLPAGPTIIIIAGLTYLAVLVGKKIIPNKFR
ncbi:MAG: metal ABC transporter permease [Desulfobulbaceae bacterium]|nr:metal ABC transporter permease [Desulfobulbaceae bacterium]HIJ79052.1 metal ABC transporter permease [Deltaproteobacteria bacterium]